MVQPASLRPGSVHLIDLPFLLSSSPGKRDSQHRLGQRTVRLRCGFFLNELKFSRWQQAFVMQILGSREPVKWLLQLIDTTTPPPPPHKRRRNTICLLWGWGVLSKSRSGCRLAALRCMHSLKMASSLEGPWAAEAQPSWQPPPPWLGPCLAPRGAVC